MPPGANAQDTKLGDVRWGAIFGMGWKLASVAKSLVILYCVMSFVQSGMNLATSQLLGTITQELTGGSRSAKSAKRTDAPQQTEAPTQTETPANNSDVKSKTPPAPREPLSKKRLVLFSVLWAVCALGVLGLGIPSRTISTKLDLTLSNNLRARLFERLLRQSPEFYHTHDPGELNAVANQFTIEAAMTMRQIAVDMLIQMLVLGGTVALLIYNFDMDGYKPVIMGVTIPPALIPIAIVLFAFISPYITGKLSHRVRDVSSDMQEKMLALNSLVTGAMQSPEEIQTMEAEPIFAKKHESQLNALLRARLKTTLTMESLNLVNGLPSWFIQVVMVGFGVFLASRSSDPGAAGHVVAIILLTPQLMAPIGALSAYIVMAGGAWPRIETVTKMLESRASREERSGDVRVTSIPPTLEAKNLTFSYKPGSRLIYDDVSFELPQGKITGFVAKTGQGKTTFFKLALRFYDPQKGQVLLGGRPVEDYAADNLYDHIAMMSQFPAFFYDTLRVNMTMAKPDATDEEIRNICEETGIWKILEAGSKGNPLDAEFAAGRRLSGGQRKLLALTRCLLRNPAVLFLDEPTVGMDNQEKFAILGMIRQAAKDHTVMVVDHDLHWLLPFCDNFIVLSEGKIAEQGTGEELLAKKGLFHDLYYASDTGAAPAHSRAAATAAAAHA
ncbi:MAG: ATP-binding cassette, subfamily bacterial [Verrucomicrobiota bacterium]|jgi:ABC-type multidrug transport system fused ATPase/permease subunit